MNSDFVIRGTEIIEYIGKGGDIIIPEGVTEIDDITFSNTVHHYEYDSIRKRAVDQTEVSNEIKDKITSIHISSTVIEINDSFRNLVNLNKVTFASNSKLETIPYMAFWGCKSLKEIELPESVKEISKYAFYDCGDVIVKIGSNCKVSPDIFGGDKCKSNGSKVVIPIGYKYKNEIPFDLLSSNNRTVSSTASSNTHTSSTDIFDFDGFQIFLIVMFFVYLALFLISVSIGSSTVLIVTIILGIINIFAFLGS